MDGFFGAMLDWKALEGLPTDVRECFALSFLLTDTLGHPVTCEGCPFGAIELSEYKSCKLGGDMSEHHYKCDLLPGTRVWGEDPPCTHELWQAQARTEIAEMVAEIWAAPNRVPPVVTTTSNGADACYVPPQTTNSHDCSHAAYSDGTHYMGNVPPETKQEWG
jgi:hypothetical protein